MTFPQQNQNPFADNAPNPYASPLSPPQLQPQFQAADNSPFAGLWRNGDVMIMHKLAPLPPICLKSNEPATTWLTRKLQWQPQWVFVLLLVNLIIFAIVALILTKRATISIGLTDEWAAKRKQRLFLAWSVGLAALGVIVVGFIFLALEGTLPDDIRIPLFLVCLIGGLMAGVGALIGGSMGCRLIYPQKMTDTHIWIKGVHPSFLDRLPIWYG